VIAVEQPRSVVSGRLDRDANRASVMR